MSLHRNGEAFGIGLAIGWLVTQPYEFSSSSASYVVLGAICVHLGTIPGLRSGHASCNESQSAGNRLLLGGDQAHGLDRLPKCHSPTNGSKSITPAVNCEAKTAHEVDVMARLPSNLVVEV